MQVPPTRCALSAAKRGDVGGRIDPGSLRLREGLWQVREAPQAVTYAGSAGVRAAVRLRRSGRTEGGAGEGQAVQQMPGEVDVETGQRGANERRRERRRCREAGEGRAEESGGQR